MRARSRTGSIGAAAALAWSLFACAAAGATELHLPVPKVTIYPGDVIQPDLIGERAFIARTVARSSIFEGEKDLIGKVARRTLLPGQPIPVNAIREPFLVMQGKIAPVVFEEGGLTISSNALALQNGSAGDVVSLRNVESGIVIKGTVAADGTVRLGTP